MMIAGSVMNQIDWKDYCYKNGLDERKCKDCFWYSDVTVKCCERDGSDPCDPLSPACSEFLNR